MENPECIHIPRFDDRCNEIVILASEDQDVDYGIDVTIIGFDPVARDFVLLYASGCSCWEGDGDEMAFSGLNALEEYLLESADGYLPSLEGSKRLIAEARESWAKEVER